MSLVFLDNNCYSLNGKLDAVSKILPVNKNDASDLCQKLGEDGHTYLTLTGLRGTEILKVTCFGDAISIERGIGDTEPMSHAVGECACFKVNEIILEEWLETAMLGGCKPKVISGDEDYIKVTENENTCTFTVDMSEEFKDSFEECCGADDCSPCNLSDGVYENATVTVVNGKVCNVSNGKNIVYTGGTCCGCD